MKLNTNLAIRVFTIMFVVILFPCLGYSAPKRDLPEFFGVYGISDGQLFSLWGGKSVARPIESFRAYPMGSSVVNKGAYKVATNVTFIVFDASASDIIGGLTLYKLPYIRNFYHGNIDMPIMGTGGGRVKTEGINTLMLARLEGAEIQLLAKPVHGQQQMVELVPEKKLTPGVYVIFGKVQDQFHWVMLAVTPYDPQVSSECIDLYFASGGFGGMMEMDDYFMRYGPRELPIITKQHFKSCGLPTSGGGGNETPAVVPAPSLCGDYNACYRDGESAAASADWQRAITDFQSAASQDPSKANPWFYLGITYLAVGRTSEFQAAWDKVITLSGSLAIGVCRKRLLQPCEQGNLFLGPEMVSFIGAGNNKVFSAPPSAVMMNGILNTSWSPNVSFGLKVEDNKYNFDFRPIGIACNIGANVVCPPVGKTQQLAVANYILNTLPKLVSGSLRKTP